MIHRRALWVATAVLAVATAAAAQEWWGRWGGYSRVPARFATAESYDGSFTYCRVMYTSERYEPGGQGWRTDYPDADVNLSIRLAELTRTRVSRLDSGMPNHLVVRLTDDALFDCPFVMIEDAGTAGFHEEEIDALRTYLQKGGFMWVDDFWGARAWDSWVRQLRRVLPSAEYPIHDLPLDHPLFRTTFDVKSLPQIPSIQFWRQSGGLTSERGAESAEPHFRAVSDRHGRIMVLMTHNTDISDAWEREGEDPRFFYSFSPDGYAVGINVLMYAMTH
jgi:hypothetical protein